MPRQRRKPGVRRGHIYRLTLSGALFVAALLLILLAAVNTQRALLLMLFGLMVGAFFLSVAAARRMLGAVEVRRDLPHRVFANRVVHLGYYVRHLRGARARPGRFGRLARGAKGQPLFVLRRPANLAVLGLEISEIDPPAALQTVGAFCLYLPRGGVFKSGSRMVIRQRGRFRLVGLRLATRFPFALLRGSRDVAQADELIVWPALGRLKADLLARGAVEVSNAAPSQDRSGADEFFGLREYRQGDNPRWIHWKRTAAVGTPVVREMAKPNPDTLYVLLDPQLDSLAPPALAMRERLISCAATLIEHAFHREYRVGLATAYGAHGVGLPPAAGMGQRTALLDALAGIDAQTSGSFSAALAAMPRGQMGCAQVVLLTADPDRAARIFGGPSAWMRISVVSPRNLDEVFQDEPEQEPGAGNTT